MGIGMAIALSVVRAKLWLMLAAAIVLTAVKAAIVWLLFRRTCSRRDALRAGSVLTGAGEFAFVLLPLGVSLGMLSGPDGSLVTAIAAMTMLIGPPFAELTEAALRRLKAPMEREPDNFDRITGSVLVTGFARCGTIPLPCM